MLASTLLALLLLADPPRPAYGSSGYTMPKEATPGCVDSHLRRPPGESFDEAVTVKFAVEPDGTADQAELLSDLPRAFRGAVATALAKCQFIPGKDPQGKTVAIWMVQRVRFDKVAEWAPRAATPPREVETGCVARHLDPRWTHGPLLRGLVFFRVEVSADGQPTRFEVPPGDVSGPEGSFQRAVRSCELWPGKDPAGNPVAATVITGFDFSPASDVELAQARGLKKRISLVDATCLRGLGELADEGRPPLAMRFRVSARGKASDFTGMEGVEAAVRGSATFIVSHCAWEPAVGLDGQPVSAETVLFFHGGRSGRDVDDPYRPPPTGRGGAYAYGTRDDPWYPVNRQP